MKLCSSRGAYEAIPDPKLQLDLPRLVSLLAKAGRPCVDARVMLVLPGQPEVTLMRDGRMVIKSHDPHEAQRAFEELRALLDLPA